MTETGACRSRTIGAVSMEQILSRVPRRSCTMTDFSGLKYPRMPVTMPPTVRLLGEIT